MALIAGGAQVTEYRNSGGISLPSTKPYHCLLRNSNHYLYLLILWTPVKRRPLLVKQLLVSLSAPTASQPLFHDCSITYFPTEPELKQGLWTLSHLQESESVQVILLRINKNRFQAILWERIFKKVHILIYYWHCSHSGNPCLTLVYWDINGSIWPDHHTTAVFRNLCYLSQ